MLTILDLNPRQLSRVVEQMQRTHATLEIMPRTWQDDRALAGTICGRESTGLLVDITNRGRDVPLISLIGVCCDVQLRLDGCVYVFSCSVVDVLDTVEPQRLILSVPESIHLTNRRKFFRAAVTESTPASIHTGELDQEIVGELWDIGPAGLSVGVPTDKADKYLLLGDRVRVTFVVPHSGAQFLLPATICNKKAHVEKGCTLVGVEFDPQPSDEDANALARLRALLCQLNLEIHEEGNR